jgi:hypothetical protein
MGKYNKRRAQGRGDIMPAHGYKMPSEADLRHARARGQAVLVTPDGRRSLVQYQPQVAA